MPTRAIVALLLCAPLLASLVGSTDANARRNGRCSRENNPTKKITYENDSMTGVFVWDTKNCFPDMFLMGAWVVLLQVTTEGYGRPALAGKICKPDKPCRLEVSIDHPLVERAEYKFKVYDQPSGKVWNSDWMTCTSAAVLASCDS